MPHPGPGLLVSVGALFCLPDGPMADASVRSALLLKPKLAAEFYTDEIFFKYLLNLAIYLLTYFYAKSI